ncbi:DNA replication factor Cdt1 [Dermacentor andersoni]|uniref:DNA replication factor Cdt1 n=1 Tax=Dermacentor andersoni TaxID=34620 RepID=UPI002155E857|nr:DNA replication factor Cdt1-like [Dermacentor andersoni]
MSLMKQTALTRYYSAKKQGSTLKNKRTELGSSVDILRTPKTVAQGLIGFNSEPCASLPHKRRRADAAEKTPVTSKQGNCLPFRRPPTSVRKRLLLHEDVDGADMPDFYKKTSAKLPFSLLEETEKKPDALLKHASDTDEKQKSAVIKRLMASGKLQELQDRLKAIDKAQTALQKVQATRKTQDQAVQGPAYERFHHLTEPLVPSLTLPYSYKELAEIFRCCDTIVSMLFNRKEVCTFDKLKRSVEEMSKKAFSKAKLGQITAIFPGAYILSREKLQQRGLADSGYHLVITPHLPPEDSNVLTAAHLLHRRKQFHALLLSAVKEHHEKFLLSLDPPVKIAADALTRWHPKFPLDSVPNICPRPLPESPLKKSCTSAQDVLDKVKGRLGERIEKALLSLSADQQSAANTPPSHSNNVASTCLKGISEDLLARIRERESFKLVKEMTLRPEDEKERAELAKLPEFIRITRSHFLAEQKAAILKDDLVQKIRESFSSIQAVAEVESLITLASKVLPDWFKVLTIRRGTFVKIVKETDINCLIARVTNKLQQ